MSTNSSSEEVGARAAASRHAMGRVEVMVFMVRKKIAAWTRDGG